MGLQKCIAACVLAASVLACQSHDERAIRLLANAEAECGLQAGLLRFMGTSDDPEFEHRRDGTRPEIEVIHVSAPDLRIETETCINQALGRGGYRMGRLITD